MANAPPRATTGRRRLRLPKKSRSSNSAQCQPRETQRAVVLGDGSQDETQTMYPPSSHGRCPAASLCSADTGEIMPITPGRRADAHFILLYRPDTATDDMLICHIENTYATHWLSILQPMVLDAPPPTYGLLVLNCSVRTGCPATCSRTTYRRMTYRIQHHGS
jgi:hypothetical protein